MTTSLIGRMLIYMIAVCAAALLLGTISEQRLISYDSRTALFVFAAVGGLLNAAVKPVLQLLALPITCLTFGLFALVINAALFGLAVAVSPGMSVTTAGAVIGAIFTSLAAGVMFTIVDEYALIDLDGRR